MKKNNNPLNRKIARAPSLLDPYNMNSGALTRIASNRDGAITSMNSNKVYRVVRASGLNHRTFTSGTLGGISVALNQVLTSDLGLLFDEYRIMAVTWKLYPDITTVDSAEQQAGTASDPGMFEFVVDYDDNNAPIATDLYEYQTYRALRFLGRNEPITSTIVPRCSVQVFDGVTPAYGSQARKWLDLAHTDVPHYGWKYHYSNSTTDVEHTFGYYEQFIFYLEFRGVR